MNNTLTIVTRKSPLALWQAEFVKRELELCHPHLTLELLPISTKGDRILDSPLAKIGGKGLFVKELEHALLENKADIAVHSMKDVPMVLPDLLRLAVICKREDPWDAFVSNDHPNIEALPQGAVVGTSSLRRQTQLRRARPDIEIKDLRGNVNTRLAKLDAGEYHSLILAAAGLKRLGFSDRISQLLSAEQSLPAVGQGAVGVEIRADDARTADLLAPLSCPLTTLRVTAERAMNLRLNGGCQVPIAGFAQYENNVLRLRGLVGAVDGSVQYTADETVELPNADISNEKALEQAASLGNKVAEHLLEQGAGQILSELLS